MEMSKPATNLWTLPSIKITVIPVEEKEFDTYVTETLGSVTDHYIGQIRDNGHINRVRDPKEKYKLEKRWKRSD